MTACSAQNGLNLNSMSWSQRADDSVLRSFLGYPSSLYAVQRSTKVEVVFNASSFYPEPVSLLRFATEPDKQVSMCAPYMCPLLGHFIQMDKRGKIVYHKHIPLDTSQSDVRVSLRWVFLNIGLNFMNTPEWKDKHDQLTTDKEIHSSAYFTKEFMRSKTASRERGIQAAAYLINDILSHIDRACWFGDKAKKKNTGAGVVDKRDDDVANILVHIASETNNDSCVDMLLTGPVQCRLRQVQKVQFLDIDGATRERMHSTWKKAKPHKKDSGNPGSRSSLFSTLLGYVKNPSGWKNKIGGGPQKAALFEEWVMALLYCPFLLPFWAHEVDADAPNAEARILTKLRFFSPRRLVRGYYTRVLHPQYTSVAAGDCGVLTPQPESFLAGVLSSVIQQNDTSLCVYQDPFVYFRDMHSVPEFGMGRENTNSKLTNTTFRDDAIEWLSTLSGVDIHTLAVMDCIQHEISLSGKRYCGIQCVPGVVSTGLGLPSVDEACRTGTTKTPGVCPHVCVPSLCHQSGSTPSRFAKTWNSTLQDISDFTLFVLKKKRVLQKMSMALIAEVVSDLSTRGLVRVFWDKDRPHEGYLFHVAGLQQIENIIAECRRFRHEKHTKTMTDKRVCLVDADLLHCVMPPDNSSGDNHCKAQTTDDIFDESGVETEKHFLARSKIIQVEAISALVAAGVAPVDLTEAEKVVYLARTQDSIKPWNKPDEDQTRVLSLLQETTGVVVVSGCAGSGKSAIIGYMHNTGGGVCLAPARFNPACRRSSSPNTPMVHTTRPTKALYTVSGGTILYLAPTNQLASAQNIRFGGLLSWTLAFLFTITEHNVEIHTRLLRPIECIIVDETSMIGGYTMVNCLLSLKKRGFCPNLRVLMFLGDTCQLEPVSGHSLLDDLICLPTSDVGIFELKKDHRSDASSFQLRELQNKLRVIIKRNYASTNQESAFTTSSSLKKFLETIPDWKGKTTKGVGVTNSTPPSVQWYSNNYTSGVVSAVKVFLDLVNGDCLQGHIITFRNMVADVINMELCRQLRHRVCQTKTTSVPKDLCVGLKVRFQEPIGVFTKNSFGVVRKIQFYGRTTISRSTSTSTPTARKCGAKPKNNGWSSVNNTDVLHKSWSGVKGKALVRVLLRTRAYKTEATSVETNGKTKKDAPPDEWVYLQSRSDLRTHFRIGYASTVHSMQGLQLRNIVFAMDRCDPKLLYTACTRCTHQLLLVHTAEFLQRGSHYTTKCSPQAFVAPARLRDEGVSLFCRIAEKMRHGNSKNPVFLSVHNQCENKAGVVIQNTHQCNFIVEKKMSRDCMAKQPPGLPYSCSSGVTDEDDFIFDCIGM
jgi:hypothetical protein